MDTLAEGFSGGCFCGAIAYRVTSAPAFAYHCHCSDCRRINGTAFHTGLAVPASDFSHTGAPAAFASRADSGHTITRWHCAACGTQLWSQTTADETIVSVKAGSVTSAAPEAIHPTLQIFVDSRVPWADVPAGLVTYARGARGEEPIG